MRILWILFGLLLTFHSQAFAKEIISLNPVLAKLGIELENDYMPVQFFAMSGNGARVALKLKFNIEPEQLGLNQQIIIAHIRGSKAYLEKKLSFDFPPQTYITAIEFVNADWLRIQTVDSRSLGGRRSLAHTNYYLVNANDGTTLKVSDFFDVPGIVTQVSALSADLYAVRYLGYRGIDSVSHTHGFAQFNPYTQDAHVLGELVPPDLSESDLWETYLGFGHNRLPSLDQTGSVLIKTRLNVLGERQYLTIRISKSSGISMRRELSSYETFDGIVGDADFQTLANMGGDVITLFHSSDNRVKQTWVMPHKSNWEKLTRVEDGYVTHNRNIKDRRWFLLRDDGSVRANVIPDLSQSILYASTKYLSGVGMANGNDLQFFKIEWNPQDALPMTPSCPSVFSK